MSSRCKKIILSVVTASLCAALIVFALPEKTAVAAFNKQINYQGKLTNASNVAVADGTYHMQFKLYTAATGGTEIWSEDRSTAAGDRVTVTNGLFSVMLGSSTALTSVNFNQTLYLGVEIGGSSGSPAWDGEMTPRKVLGAVPAAFEADKIDGLSSEQFLRSDAANSTSTASTFLTFTQNGAGKIAEFFGPSSASVLSLLSGGNVGIGTTTPYAKLSVAGRVLANNFYATSSNLSNYFMGTTTVGTLAESSKFTVAAGDFTIEIGDLDDVRGVHAADASGNTGSLADTAAGAGVYGNGSIYGVRAENNSASGYGLYSRQTDADGYSIFSSGGKNYFENNVGIGTSSPYAKLSVVGQTVSSYFTATTTTASTFPYASSTALTISGAGGLFLNTSLNGPLHVNAGIVGATTSVGVVYGGTGLTSLAQGDLIYGSAANVFSALSKSTTANSFLKNSGSSNNPQWSTIASTDLSDTANIALLNQSQTWTGTPTFSNSSTYSALFTGGFVGFGTSTPWGKVSINPNGIGAVPSFVIGSSTATNFIVTHAGNVGIGSTSPYASFVITNNTARPSFVIEDKNSPDDTPTLFASSSGQVGFGTSSPFARVSILGEQAVPGLGQVDQYALAVHGGNAASGFGGNGGGIWLRGGDGGDNELDAGGNGGDFIFQAGAGASGATNGRNGFILLQPNFGNVGIGTTSPYAKLSVVGQVVGSYFTATTSTASVFPYASSTALTVSGIGYFGTASTTNLTVSGISGCSGSSALTTNASGVVACGAISGGSTFPFTPATNFGVNTSATSTPIWAQSGIYASSTSYFVYASTTALTVSGNAYFPGSGIWNSSGNVGIGTTTPNSTLTVSGNLYVAGTLGSNLVSNGTFDSDLTGWSGTNWSHSSGGALHTAGSVEPLVSTTFSPTIGQTYRVDFDTVGVSAGYVTMYFGGVYGKAAIGNNTYTEYITVSSSTPFSIYPETDFNGRIDNVSVRLLTSTGTTTIETPIEFRKKLIINDRIEFPEGRPIIIGYQALPNNEKGDYNVPSSNVCIGFQACKFQGTGQVTAIGYQAGMGIINGDEELDQHGSLTAIGKWAGAFTTSGHATFVGNAAGRSNTTADSHCLGDESCALSSTTTVTAMGSYASSYNVYGQGISAFGRNASREGENPAYSSVFGDNAGFSNNSQYASIYGYQSGYVGAMGGMLTCYGSISCRLTTTGNITALGLYAGYNNTTGRGIYLGNGAGLGGVGFDVDPTNSPTTDTDFIFLGGDTTRDVTAATQRTNYVVIGYGARNTKSNQVVLGNTSIVETLLQGNVGIGTSTPYAKLGVGGTVVANNYLATTSVASTFPYASTTMVSATTASTTNLTISGISGCSSTSALTTNSAGVVACGAIAGGGGTFPFTPETNFGVNTSATGTPIWAKSGIYASSTSQFDYASTTALTVTGSSFFGGGTGIWNSSGNVGVGTTSPWGKLSVQGNSDIPALVLKANGTQTTNLFAAYNSSGALLASLNGDGTRLSVNNSGRKLTLGGLVGAESSYSALWFVDTPSVSNYSIAGNSNNIFINSPNGGVFLRNAESDILAVFNNKVGVGSTSPFSKLSVHLAASETSFTSIFSIASSTASAATTLFDVSNTGVTTIGNPAGTGDSNMQFANDNDAWSIGYSSANKAFNIASSTSISTNVAFTITKGSSLAVGVGTTSPWRAFAVTGTVGFDGLTSSIGAGSLCLSSNKEVVYNSGSDACLSSLRDTKHDISPLEIDALDIIDGLESVSFVYNEGDGRTRYGFIAEDAAAVDAHLSTYNEFGKLSGIDDRAITSISVKAIKQLNINLESLASSTLMFDGDALEGSAAFFAKKFFDNIFARIISWLADASNNIGNVFAAAFVAEEKICVEDQCLTKQDIKKLLLLVGNTQSANSGNPVPPSSQDAEAPVIILNGDNPAHVNVHEEYKDAGATATDNIDGNVSYTVSVDGGIFVVPEDLFVDTSEAGEHLVVFSATDSDGNTTVAQRRVIVEGDSHGSGSGSSSSGDAGEPGDGGGENGSGDEVEEGGSEHVETKEPAAPAAPAQPTAPGGAGDDSDSSGGDSPSVPEV